MRWKSKSVCVSVRPCVCLSVCLWSAAFLSGERGSPVHSMGRVTLDRKQRGQPPCVTACVRRQEGVFHWRKRLRFSVVCHRQGKRFSWYGGSVRPESQTIAPRSYCTIREGGEGGQKPCFIRITSTVICGCPPSVISSLMVIGYWNWWWVQKQNRELAGGVIGVFNLSGGGNTILYFLSLVPKIMQ